MSVSSQKSTGRSERPVTGINRRAPKIREGYARLLGTLSEEPSDASAVGPEAAGVTLALAVSKSGGVAAKTVAYKHRPERFGKIKGWTVQSSGTTSPVERLAGAFPSFGRREQMPDFGREELENEKAISEILHEFSDSKNHEGLRAEMAAARKEYDQYRNHRK